ncbi:MAG: acetyl-CoA carboxylase biotin carboxyl carrier protein subunit, partial [Vitreoscilla sp.]|nr:acetyl-CoA carboxylase biotin carboxyl carrier protein subunit [Vitreoscilla sp.]
MSQILTSPVQGTVIAIEAAVGQTVPAGQVVVLIESMKMEIPVSVPQDAQLQALLVAVGDAVHEGDVLAHWAPAAAHVAITAPAQTAAPAG